MIAQVVENIVEILGFCDILFRDIMRYFSSDLHFGSDEVLTIDSRFFKNEKHFKKCIVKSWNKQTTKNDTIYVVGDFVDYHAETANFWKENLSIVKKFKAPIILIIGNNEQRIIKNHFNNDFNLFKDYCLKVGFEDVLENTSVEIGGINFFVTHKPVDCKMNQLNLFGHSHRACGIYKSFGFHIGCDMNHFKLFSEEDIKMLLKCKEEYWQFDKNLTLV